VDVEAYEEINLKIKINIMKKLIVLAMIFSIASCNGPKENNKQNPPVSKLTHSVEEYAKGGTNNPNFYKSISTSEKSIVTEPLLIEKCFSAKYRTIKIDFDIKAPVEKEVKASDIKEKFYSVVHDYEQQNNSGAIIRSSMLLYIDDSDKIVMSYKYF